MIVEGRQRRNGIKAAQIAVAQPQPSPYHQAEIKSEQRVREQGTADPHMRGHRATEIAGEQDGAEDRGRRDRIEHGADDGDEAEAPRQRFARTIAHPVHGFGDDRPRHQLDGAVDHQEHDDEAAHDAAGPACGLGGWKGFGDDGHDALRVVLNGGSDSRRTRGAETDRGWIIFSRCLPLLPFSPCGRRWIDGAKRRRDG